MTAGDMYLIMTLITVVIAIPTILWIKHENKKH